MDIHAEKGMQCADCHFAQDSHGNGLIYGEVANAVEIGCQDCHGTADAYPTLLTSGPAAPPKGNNLALLRNPDGQRRFEWSTDSYGRRTLTQRSIVDPRLSWQVSLVKDAVDPSSPRFNAKSARAKLMSATGAEDGKFGFGPGVSPENRAHKDPEAVACFTCHSVVDHERAAAAICRSRRTGNRPAATNMTAIETRNFATYNPQVARDEMFQLGKHQTTKGNQIAPIRSTSALVLSARPISTANASTSSSRRSARTGLLQPGVRARTSRIRCGKTETKTCTDCHLSSEPDDNNAIMSQAACCSAPTSSTFVGLNAWTGLEGGFQAIRVTEWDEPQSVIGSYLQKYAYPGLLEAPRRSGSWPRTDRTGVAVQNLRRQAASRARPTRSRNSANTHPVDAPARPRRLPADCAANICSSPKGKRRFQACMTSLRSPTRASPTRIITAAGLGAGAEEHASSTASTPPAWRCRRCRRSRPLRNFTQVTA